VRFAPSRGDHQKSETEKTFVASASTDGDAKVWCVATGGLIATLRGHADVCWHVKFIEALSDENAAFAVTAGRDGLAKTWRVPLRAAAAADDDATPRCVSTLRAHDDAILAIAAWDSVTPLLATCGADDVVNVWRVEDGALLQTLRGHSKGVLCATFCVWENSLTLVTGSADATVRVWDVTSGSCSGVIEHHGAPVTQVIARADALATVAPGDGVMAYWRLVDADEKCVEDASGDSPRAGSASLPSGLRASMTLMDGAGSGFSACLAMDRKMLAVGTKTGTVHVLDFRRNKSA
jgi:WD40 repeat protein